MLKSFGGVSCCSWFLRERYCQQQQDLTTFISFFPKHTLKERFPEQYPAVIDEWADPVESDNADMAPLRPLLKNTNLEFRGLKLTYSANRDGWNAKKFHNKVDKLGGALVVCTTSDGLVCGGCKYDSSCGVVNGK